MVYGASEKAAGGERRSKAAEAQGLGCGRPKMAFELRWGGFPGAASRGPVTSIERKPKMNKLTVKGNWNESKGKLKQKYAKLTDDDLRYVEGKEEEFLGRLQKTTGARREELEKILNS